MGMKMEMEIIYTIMVNFRPFFKLCEYLYGSIVERDKRRQYSGIHVYYTTLYC